MTNKNGDMPSMPINNPDLASCLELGADGSKGFTKREKIAMYAMSGILSNSGGVIQGNNYSGTGWCNSDATHLAKLSIECADALLKELEK